MDDDEEQVELDNPVFQRCHTALVTPQIGSTRSLAPGPITALQLREQCHTRHSLADPRLSASSQLSKSRHGICPAVKDDEMHICRILHD